MLKAFVKCANYCDFSAGRSPYFSDLNACRPTPPFRYPFLNDPKNFLKATLAPIFTNFEGERAPTNAIFWSTLFGVFFQKVSCVAENLSKWGLFSDSGELRESIWST